MAPTNFFAIWTISPLATRRGAIWSRETSRAQALASVFATGVRVAFALFLAILPVGSRWAADGTIFPSKSWGTVAFTGLGIARGLIFTLANAATVVPVKPRGTSEFAVSSIATRSALATTGEPVTGPVQVAVTVILAVRTVTVRFAGLVTVWAGPTKSALAHAICWVANGVVLTLAPICATQSPRVGRTRILAFGSCVSCGTVTLS